MCEEHVGLLVAARCATAWRSLLHALVLSTAALHATYCVSGWRCIARVSSAEITHTLLLHNLHHVGLVRCAGVWHNAYCMAQILINLYGSNLYKLTGRFFKI